MTRRITFRTFKKELGLAKSALQRLIQAVYHLLGLITFYTVKGGKEVRAWSINRGSLALRAAGKVHTDMAKGFIKAEVIEAENLFTHGSWQKAKESGVIQLQGRDYQVQDGDVIEFKFSA